MAWILENDRPIYTQIVEKVQLRVISGFYKEGERLPSVRELAAEAGVNPNTMQRAFAELERSGLIQTQRTVGRTVTEDGDMIRKIKMELAEEQIRTFMENMKELGLDKNEIIALLEQACQEGE